MELGELNERILQKYAELIQEHDLNIEQVIKSSACVTGSLFDQVCVESIDTGDAIVLVTKKHINKPS